MQETEMRKYRYFSNIRWGKNYNPKDGAHHVTAVDFRAFKRQYPHVHAQHVQILNSYGWNWVTKIPAALGGISEEWHSSKNEGF